MPNILDAKLMPGKRLSRAKAFVVGDIRGQVVTMGPG